MNAASAETNPSAVYEASAGWLSAMTLGDLVSRHLAAGSLDVAAGHDDFD